MIFFIKKKKYKHQNASKIDTFTVFKTIRSLFSFEDIRQLANLFTKCVAKKNFIFPVHHALVEPFIIQYTKAAAIQYVSDAKHCSGNKLKWSSVMVKTTMTIIRFCYFYAKEIIKKFTRLVFYKKTKLSTYASFARKSSTGETFLFVCSYVNELNPQLPVINFLAKNGQIVTLLVPSEAQNWKKINSVDKRVRLLSWSFIKHHKLSHFVNCIQFAYLFTALFEKKGIINSSKSAATMLSTLLKQYSANNFYLSLMKNIKPHKVVMGFVKRPLNAAVFWQSKEMGVETFFLPHALFSAKPYMPFVFASEVVDNIFCHTKNQFNGFGVKTAKPHRMFVVGNPLFDKIIYEGKELKKSSHPETKNKILYLTSVGDPENEAVLLFMTMQRLPGYTFSIKLHPSGKANYYKELSKAFGAKVEILEHSKVTEPLSEVISKSSVCLAGRTNAAIEVLLSGKPLVTLSVNDNEEIYHFEKYDLPSASSSEDLCEIIQKINDSVEYRNLVIEKQNQVINELLWKKANTTATERISLILADKLDEAVEKGALVID